MLAAESHRALAELLSDAPLQFDYAAAGKLILYRDAKALESAGRLAEIKKQYGFRIEILDRAPLPRARSRARPLRQSVRRRRPCAGRRGRRLRQIHPRALCLLRDKMGVETRSSTRVAHLKTMGGRVAGVELDGEEALADAVVLANGIDAPRLAATVGLRLPIEPVKGYSITAPARPEAPVVSLTDRAEKIVFAHLGGRLRAAAFADLDGWSSARQSEARAAVAGARAPPVPDGRPLEPGRAGMGRPAPDDAIRRPADRRKRRAGTVSQRRPRRPGLDAGVRGGEAAGGDDRVARLVAPSLHPSSRP